MCCNISAAAVHVVQLVANAWDMLPCELLSSHGELKAFIPKQAMRDTPGQVGMRACRKLMLLLILMLRMLMRVTLPHRQALT
jgi:hypothetical protein